MVYKIISSKTIIIARQMIKELLFVENDPHEIKRLELDLFILDCAEGLNDIRENLMKNGHIGIFYKNE